jgi:methylated-DNA-[protein]-cysteine S-methyltransferase
MIKLINLETFLAYYRSPIGILSIKSYGDSIAEILFVNSPRGQQVNEDEIEYAVPKTTVIKKCIKQLEEYFSGKRKKFDLKLTFSGSAFQRKVWGELINIPYGKHISYLTLSRRIENAGAIRAVGTANGCNKVCIVVPCHRVIGTDGSLVGYGGDLWRKKWLLDHEAKIAHGVQELF